MDREREFYDVVDWIRAAPKLKYCGYVKCQSLAHADCTMAMSGESCWTIYSHAYSEDGKFNLYEFYLEEREMNLETT